LPLATPVSIKRLSCMRELARPCGLFSGRLDDASAYNRNVLITGPGLVALAAEDGYGLVRNLAKG